MPYPSSVNTRFVSVGIPREAIGWREVNADVTLNPLFSTALDLTSGGLVRGVPQKVELRAENGWQQTVQVLAGEQEHLSITNFDLQISYTFYDGLPAPDPFRVRIPKWTGAANAAPVIDLDLVLPVTSPGSPLTNVPFVTPDQLELRLAGLGSGGGASDASVEALVKDPASKTSEALGTNYARRPSGGTDGQALVRSGSGTAWATVGSGTSVPTLVPVGDSLAGIKAVQLTRTVATRAQFGLPTIYTPYLIRVPDAVFAAYPALGRWRVYNSTDHDSGAGGIAMVYTDALDPTDPAAVWTPYRTPGGSALLFNPPSGAQVETAWPEYNPLTNLFHLFYQRQSDTDSTVQYTEVITSADGVSGWSTPVIAVPNPAGMAPWNHTGYARVYRIEGLWVAVHLLGSGTVGNAQALSYSYDGIRFILDRNLLQIGLQNTDGVLNFGISSLVRIGGRLMALGRQSTPASGTALPTVSRLVIFPIRANLRGLEGRARPLPLTLPDGTAADDGLPQRWEPLPDGRLVGAVRRAGGAAPPTSTDSVRLVVLSA